MKKTKILITVEGGIVQSVISNGKDVDVVVIDYDRQSDEEAIIAHYSPPEQLKPIYKEFHELFTDASDPTEMEVRDELKRMHF